MFFNDELFLMRTSFMSDASPHDDENRQLREWLKIVDPEVGRDNPTPSSEVVIKSTSTFPNLFLEETNTVDNSFPESETFRFNLEEIFSSVRSDVIFIMRSSPMNSLTSYLHRSMIISALRIEPELGNLTMDVVDDIFPTRERQGSSCA
ncbi:hypothetical protein Tco_0602477 [Tanacetum coccineum]